jgi:hypothetical protein
MARLDYQTIGVGGPPLVPPGTGPFDVRIDEAARIVRTEARGFWTLMQTEDYCAELADRIEECRRRFGCARVLVDRRDAPIQPIPVIERLGEFNATHFADSDRLAIVVESSLAKGQMRRHFTHAGSQAFLSYVAAELWLTAWP